jgi:hypothetical protein
MCEHMSLLERITNEPRLGLPARLDEKEKFEVEGELH